MHRHKSFFVAAVVALASPAFAADNQQPNTPPPYQQPVGSGQQLKKKSTDAAEKAKKLVGRPNVVPDPKPSLPPVSGPNTSNRRPVARPDAPPPSSQDKEKADETLLKKPSKGVAKKPEATNRPGFLGQGGPGTSGQLPGVDQQPAIQEGIEAAREADAANQTRLRDGKLDPVGGTSRFDPSNPKSQAFQRPDGIGARGPDGKERDRSRYWGLSGAPGDGQRQGAPEGIGWATHMWERGPDPANSEPQSIDWRASPSGFSTTQKFRTSDGWAFREDVTDDEGSSTWIHYHRGSDGAQTDTYEENRDEQGRVTDESWLNWETGKWVTIYYDYDKTGRRYVVDTRSGRRDEPDPKKDPAPDDTSGDYPNPLPWWHSRSMWSLSQESPYERMGDPLSDRGDRRGERGEGGTSSSSGAGIGSKLGWITDPVPFDNWPGGGGGGYNDPGPGGDPNPAEPPEPPRP